MSFEEWAKQNLEQPVPGGGFEAWRRQNRAMSGTKSMEQIQARQQEILRSFPGLFDSPYPGPGADVGKMIDDYSIRSGLDREDLQAIASQLDKNNPQFEQKWQDRVRRRQYKNVMDELQWGAAGGILNVGSAAAGTVASGENWFSRSPLFWPLTRFGPLKSVSMPLSEDADRWEAKAQELYSWAQGYEVQPGEGGGIMGFVANATGQTLPMMTASIAATAVLGPVGGWAVSASIEGDNWYRQALADGQSPEEAALGRVVVGTINGIVELGQVGAVMRLGKGAEVGAMQAFKEAIRDRALKKLAAATGKIGVATVKSAIEEGTEEVIQQWVADGAAVVSYGKNIDLKTEAMNSAQSFAGGASVGWLFGSGNLVLFGHGQLNAKADTAQKTQDGQRTGQTMDEVAAKLRGDRPELPPMVMTEEEVAAYEAKREAGQQAPASEPAAQAAGAGEGSPAMAPGSLPASQGSQQVQGLWSRLTSPETFVPANEDEAAAKQLYDEGLIDSPDTLQEVLTPETVAPSARVTRQRIDDILNYVTPDGRDAINSREKGDLKEAYRSERAQQVYANPEDVIRKINEGGAITREERAGLVMNMASLVAKQDEIRKLRRNATDDATRTSLSNEEERIGDLIDRVGIPLASTNSEWGSTGRMIQMYLNENLEPGYVQARAVAKRGGPLTEQEQKMVAKLTDEINAAKQRIAELDQKIAEYQANETVQDKPQRRRRQAESKEDIQARIEKNKAKLKALLQAGC